METQEKPAVESKHFAKIPASVLGLKDLSSTAKLVYGEIHSLSGINNNGYAWPGQRALADAIGVSPATVNRVVGVLKAAGLVTVKTGKGRATNEYRVVVPGGDITTQPETVVPAPAEHYEQVEHNVVPSPAEHLYPRQRNANGRSTRATGTKKNIQRTTKEKRPPAAAVSLSAAPGKEKNEPPRATEAPKPSQAAANLAALGRFGVATNKRTRELAAMPGLTPALVEAEAARGARNGPLVIKLEAAAKSNARTTERTEAHQRQLAREESERDDGVAAWQREQDATDTILANWTDKEQDDAFVRYLLQLPEGHRKHAYRNNSRVRIAWELDAERFEELNGAPLEALPSLEPDGLRLVAV